eukprot:217218_1
MATVSKNEPENYLVFGYIHKLEAKHKVNIPNSIIQLCLQFYFLDEDVWDKETVDDGLEIDGKILKNTGDGYIHCFGMKSVTTGHLYQCTYTWEIKCLHVLHSFAVGIIDENKAKPNIKQYFYNLEYAYGYRQDGAKIANGNWCYHWAPEYVTNDIISVILDLNKCTLSFKKNGKNLGIAYKNLPKMAYKLAIYSYNDSGKCELYSSGRNLD